MKKHWGVLAIFIAVAAIAFAIGGAPLIRFLADQERMRAWIEGLGVWGPLALIAMIVVQTVLSVSPVSLLAVAGAYVFGFWQGVLYAFIGLAIGSALVHDSGAALWAAAGRSADRSEIDRHVRSVYGEARADFLLHHFCHAVGAG